eukprot:SAG22_NODE_62_length_23371_cov_84.500602_2_plen_64_part_00
MPGSERRWVFPPGAGVSYNGLGSHEKYVAAVSAGVVAKNPSVCEFVQVRQGTAMHRCFTTVAI